MSTERIYKAIPFVERLNNDIYKVTVTIDKTIPHKMLKSKEVLNEHTKRVTRKSKLETYNQRENLKKYKFSDFIYENLLAVGFIKK